MSAHDSVLETPQPSAWSTETKRADARSSPQQTRQDVKRNLMNMDISTESLGILSLDDMRASKDSLTTIHAAGDPTSKILAERQRALESTRALLRKYENFRNQSLLSESTVNESDLRESSSCAATPSARSAGSTINESDLLGRSDSVSRKQNESLTNQFNTMNLNSLKNRTFGDLNASTSSQSMIDYIKDIQTRFEANSSASLSDILGNVTKQSLEFDSGMFQPAEDLKDQFEEDEKAWRQKYASLPSAERASFASQPSSELFDEKMSFGNYFAARSDNCSLFKAGSPSRRQPVALINSTAIDVEDAPEQDESAAGLGIGLNESNISAIDRSTRANNRTAGVLSLSQIQNLISGEEHTPGKLVERLLTAPLVYNPDRTKHSEKSAKNASFKESKACGTPQKSEAATPMMLKDGYYHSRSSLGSPSVSSMSKLKYASSADLRTPRKEDLPSSTKIYAAKSLNSIHDDKENVLRPAAMREEKNRTLTSCGSTSSMDSIPDGCVKLASNKAELVWGCVKEGRAVQQDVTIRNKNNRRVKYLIQTTNPSFKLSNIEPQGVIVLHALETRQLHVTCAPCAPGPQTGHLTFTPVVHKEAQPLHKQHVAMYAHGGHVNVHVRDVARDLTGKLWLSFGSLDGRRELARRFVVRNAGTVDGFVSLGVCNKNLCAYDDVAVAPQRAVIRRNSEIDVTVTFRPSKSDLQLLTAALGGKSARNSEIAVIKMMSGPDINRQRINKIVKKMAKDEGVRRDPFVQQLGAVYRHAQRGDDVRHFNESARSFKTLMQTLECAEISLLVDRDLDATLMPEPDDTTVLFKTMVCPDDSSYMEHLSERSYLRLCSVEPNKVILTPPTKKRDCFFLASNYDRTVEFKTFVHPAEEGLALSPSAGTVRPGEILKVLAECEEVKMARQDFEVVFEVDDEVLKVSVSVLNI